MNTISHNPASSKLPNYIQLAMKNQSAGKKFLRENRGKSGVKFLPSGLQYKVLKKGIGGSPKKTDTVEVNYRGTLIDGTEFDSSYSRGKPSVFGLDKVIKGWTEGLQKMKVGAKFEFVVPSELAYGKSGLPGKIGPHETLIFEVELLDIK